MFTRTFNNIKKESIMKKVLFAVMAMIAIGFTSCGNKQAAPAEEQEVAVNVDDAVSEITAALSEQIEAGDVNKFQEVLATVQEKIKEFIGNNPEVAKEYVAKVQDFLKENADKIKAFVGENETVNAAITALTAAPAETESYLLRIPSCRAAAAPHCTAWRRSGSCRHRTPSPPVRQSEPAPAENRLPW